MAHALELTWMVVRADGGQEREVLLQKGQTARFSADTGFVVTIGNAGGVELTLNGEPVPSLGASGQVIRDLAIPSARRASGARGESFPERVQTPPER
jgi:cytoskeleton protein RodZ